jgi:hypothetical protein
MLSTISNKKKLRKNTFMTLSQLEVWIKEAKRLGITGDIELKVHHPEASNMTGVVAPVKDLEFRSVQCYNSDASEYRNKYILIK